MDVDLHAMNGTTAKSSSFTVKDILDLPKGKPICSPVDTGTTTVSAASLRAIPSVPEVPELPTVNNFYDNDNPYTRWLQNNDAMHYTSK